MPMPIGKVPVSPSIKPAAMVVMASPSIILTVRPISIGAIAGRTARQRAALTRSITSAVFRAIGVIGTPAGAVISITVLVIVMARITVAAIAA